MSGELHAPTALLPGKEAVVTVATEKNPRLESNLGCTKSCTHSQSCLVTNIFRRIVKIKRGV